MAPPDDRTPMVDERTPMVDANSRRSQHARPYFWLGSGVLVLLFGGWSRPRRATRSALTYSAADDGPGLSAQLAADADDYSESLSACAWYDDDAVYPSETECPHYDHNFCTGSGEDTGNPSFDNGTVLHALCADACIDRNYSYVMVCAWEAVAALPRVCAGRFASAFPTNSSDRSPSSSSTASSSSSSVATDSARPSNQTKLFSCDEHAFCYSCGDGNPYCEAVAAHYHGVGEGGTTANRSRVGATSAVVALNDDLEYWCSERILAAIDR